MNFNLRPCITVAEMLQTGGRPNDALLVIERALALAPHNLDALAKKGRSQPMAK